jgi:hypothetical protein
LVVTKAIGSGRKVVAPEAAAGVTPDDGLEGAVWGHKVRSVHSALFAAMFSS